MTYNYRDILFDLDRLDRGNSSGRAYRSGEVELTRLEDRGNSGGRECRVINSGSVAPEDHAEYVNRCWHYTNEEFVRWTTSDDPDPFGASYPGPGTFGVNTTSPAVVESWTPA